MYQTKTEIELIIHRIVHSRLSGYALALLLFCGIVKLDAQVWHVFRKTYDDSYAMVISHLREGEMTRVPLSVGSGRYQTYSGE
jgi:hypothetical protein